MTPQEITAFIIQLAKHFSLSKTELAGVLGISRPTLYVWLAKPDAPKTAISVARLQALADKVRAVGPVSRKELLAERDGQSLLRNLTETMTEFTRRDYIDELT